MVIISYKKFTHFLFKFKETRMKILWLSHLIPYPPKGGVLQRTHNMIKEVSKHHEITLFTFNQVDFLAASLPDSKDPLTEARNELLKIVKQVFLSRFIFHGHMLLYSLILFSAI